MPITFVVTFKRDDKIYDFAYLSNTIGKEHMKKAMKIVREKTQQNAPVFLGTFRRSIKSKIEAATIPHNSPGTTPSTIGVIVRGSVYSTDVPSKVEAIESGRPYGSYIPIDAARLWAAKKLGLLKRPKHTRHPEALVRGINPLAFVLNAAIFRRGIPARQVFKKSFEETQTAVNHILTVELPAAIAESI